MRPWRLQPPRFQTTSTINSIPTDLVEKWARLRFSDTVEVWNVDELVVEAEAGVGGQVLALVQNVRQVSETTIPKKRNNPFRAQR